MVAGRLKFTINAEQACSHGTVMFIAVGTPPDEDGSADLQYVVTAARDIGRRMTDNKVVVDKSTVPAGTADKVRAVIHEELTSRGVSVPFAAVVSNPEFLKEGASVEDFMRPDRIIVGADNEQAIFLMRALYAPFVRNHDRMLVMDVRSVELTLSPCAWDRIGRSHRLFLLVCRMRLRRAVLSEGRQGARENGERAWSSVACIDGGRACKRGHRTLLTSQLRRPGRSLSVSRGGFGQ